MRILKFFLVFLSTALFIFALVFLLNRAQFTLLFENRDAMEEGSEWVESIYTVNGVADYILNHPDKASLLVYSLADSTEHISYRADAPGTMGLLSSVIVATAYESAFESGRLDPDSLIALSDISILMLPGVGESRHSLMIEQARASGMVEDGHIGLRESVELLIRYNSPSLYDYLLMSYGREDLNLFMREAGLENTDPLLPLSGLALTLSSALQDESVDVIMTKWTGADTDSQSTTVDSSISGPPASTKNIEFENTVWNYTHLYIDGPDRLEWQELIGQEQLSASFINEREKLKLYPKTTTRELTRMLTHILSGSLISEDASRRLLNLFRMSMEGAPTTEFSDAGAVFHDRIGLMNGLGFYQQNTTEGQAEIVALILDDLQIAVWFHMSSNLMHQKFMQRLAWDSELKNRLRSEIE